MFNIGPVELIVILVVALVVVGPKRLPEVGRTIGRSLREFRRAQDDVKRSLEVEFDGEPSRPRTRTRTRARWTQESRPEEEHPEVNPSTPPDEAPAAEAPAAPETTPQSGDGSASHRPASDEAG